MALAERVRVARRYRRAIRIETDFGDPAALEGFVCPQSSAEVLETMAQHLLNTGQGAFTWTGPYGGGKSSLAVVLGAMLSGDDSLRGEALNILGQRTSSLLAKALPTRRSGWRVLPVSGRQDSPVQVIGEAITTAGWTRPTRQRSTWSQKTLLDTMLEIADKNPRETGGLAVFIDELGKFLEGAAREGTDIHFFQELAELASRSGGRLLVVGILHQAFDEYARNLSTAMRDEWAKIQGRFIDLPISVHSSEQVDLLARAIETDRRTTSAGQLATGVASLIAGHEPDDLGRRLEDCWPLHPVTACFLGPLSRRRFGQNQRSLFGFLNSAEPHGFREFLQTAPAEALYTPDRLWDYLQVNLEPSILASPDSHRWALASDALARCESAGGAELHLKLLKVIALADLLKERSHLPASQPLLELACSGHSEPEIAEGLLDLKEWSLTAFRKFTDAWTIFEGSDFDVDRAVRDAIYDGDHFESQTLEQFAIFRPVVAKRHYHKTGALRWVNVKTATLENLEGTVGGKQPTNGAIGRFYLVIPTNGESRSKAKHICRKAISLVANREVAIGLSSDTWRISELVVELAALETVRDNHPELRGDRVARLEVRTRIGAVRDRLDCLLAKSLENAYWYQQGKQSVFLTRADLNSVASEMADTKYNQAPCLTNELLGRVKPSSNAIAARNALLRKMVCNRREERLGIKGFPAEGGLYSSLLEASGLHQRTQSGYQFVSPDTADNDPCGLGPLWIAARKFLETERSRQVSVSELYQLWNAPPFGVKDGLLPVLTVAFLLAEQDTLAFYRQGIFQVELSELDVAYLAKNPADIHVRWMTLSGLSRDLLSNLTDVLCRLDEENQLSCHEPLDIARRLVAIHDRLPPWVGRTQRLSRKTIQIRQLLKQANDPHKLLFDDLPNLHPASSNGTAATASEIASTVYQSLREMQNAYPAMIARLREILLSELDITTTASGMMRELRTRAANVQELGGNHRQEGFIMRLAKFSGTDSDVEGLASMAVNKPLHQWIDPDVDRAMVELADMASRFVRAEAYAHVKGRQDKRHAMAVVVGLDGTPTPLHTHFHITDFERGSVDAVLDSINLALHSSGEQRSNVLLAALARASVPYLTHIEPETASHPNVRTVNA